MAKRRGIRELDKDISKLLMSRRDLYIQNDKGLLKGKRYQKKLDEVESEIKQLTSEKMTLMQQEMVQREVVLSNGLEKVNNDIKQIRRSKGIKLGRKEQDNSFASIIIRALMSGKFKTIDSVADHVEKVRPGRQRSKTKTQIKAVIYRVKIQLKPRWDEYTWDEKNFLLRTK